MAANREGQQPPRRDNRASFFRERENDNVRPGEHAGCSLQLTELVASCIDQLL